MIITRIDTFLPGSGGGTIDSIKRKNQGRKCILLHKKKDVAETLKLAKAVGLDIVECIYQSGKENHRTFFGSGKLNSISAELEMNNSLHPWYNVDLVLIHSNANPIQMVELNKILRLECWDRVRLLLNLFTTQANSVEAKLQVKLAKLNADKTIMREFANLQNRGERLGWGAGGRHALESNMKIIDREISTLLKKKNRREKSEKERRKHRIRNGIKSIGLIGYTNAGKSSLFQNMAGKPVLIEDQLFSTLETTIGRMQKSPRILMVDTIGFIDNLPTILLDAFKSTIKESITCDLVLLIIDASDNKKEFIRKLETTLKELESHEENFDYNQIQPVLTKSDLVNDKKIKSLSEVIINYDLEKPIITSSANNLGIEKLRNVILLKLFDKPKTVIIQPPTENNHISQLAIISHLHKLGYIISETKIDTIGQIQVVMWADRVALIRYALKSNNQLII